MHDLVIANARVVDGTGAASFFGSVAVCAGRIAEVTGGNARKAARTIDVAGQVVAPGFVDVHTHSDFTLPVRPQADAMLRQGVTTQVVGNCGFSPFPVSPETLDEWRAASSFIDGGLAWGEWDDAASYMEYLQRARPACNVAVLIGHGAVRVAVMGFEERSPTDRERERMRHMIAEALTAGAVGMSTGLTYAPGTYATPAELVLLARDVGRSGGFYATHIRSEGNNLLRAVDEALDIGRQAGVPVQISHLKALGRTNWPLVDGALEKLDAAVASGSDVMADQYPYTAGSTTLTVHVPPWVLREGTAGMQVHLRNASTRGLIRSQILAQHPDDRRAGLREFEPENLRLAQLPPGTDAAWEGLSVSEVAELRGEEAVDTLLYLLEVGGGGVLTTVHRLSEDRVRQIMAHRAVAIASDGWTLHPSAGGIPHPRSYGTYARVLGHYVRDEKVLALEEAVRKMTSLPARRLRGFGLGRIEPGLRADLVVFDPDAIADHATFEAPHRFSTGVSHVLVNGCHVVEDGVLTLERPGRVLRQVQ